MAQPGQVAWPNAVRFRPNSAKLTPPKWPPNHEKDGDDDDNDSNDNDDKDDNNDNGDDNEYDDNDDADDDVVVVVVVAPQGAYPRTTWCGEARWRASRP